jgi:hypothetical protein
MAAERTTVDGGVMYKNNRKEEGTNQPDYRGFCHIDGKEYETSGWIREGRNGKFISYAMKPRREESKKYQNFTYEDRTEKPDVPF